MDLALYPAWVGWHGGGGAVEEARLQDVPRARRVFVGKYLLREENYTKFYIWRTFLEGVVFPAADDDFCQVKEYIIIYKRGNLRR